VKRRLLDLLLCPNCHGAFALEAFQEEATRGWRAESVACVERCAWRGTPVDDSLSADDCARCYATDVLEGRLDCAGCGARFPIINGVPRLLRPALLARIKLRYPEFFARHPEFLAGVSQAPDPLADTLESFTRQRLDLRPPGPEFAHQWTDNLRRNLGPAASLDSLRGALVLDVGCGFGRHLYVASEAGAEVVGVDLSGGVDVARQNNLGHPRCHIVQADVTDRPFRDGSFDVVWSFGVLHHMPDPRGGFDAIAPFARPDGGLVAIWVYGYRGMRLTYRLSHMRALHRVSRRLSSRARVRISKAVAGALSVLYWEPLRLARRLGLRRLLEHLPLTQYVEHGWIARVAGVHDRLSTPITNFHDREDLLEWFGAARLEDVRVEDTDRRGWRACGRRHAPALATVEA
jgi:SAM-dependent methyltransferase